ARWRRGCCARRRRRRLRSPPPIPERPDRRGRRGRGRRGGGGSRRSVCTTGREMQRRYPVGAEVVDGGVHFCVWAPALESLAVVIDGEDFSLEPDGRGY